MTEIIAHRGASAAHPENTLLAFERALQDQPQAAGLECDVRLSADGIPFVFHDDETTRLTGVKGSIEARRAAEIDTLRVSNTPIPTLESLCTHLNGYTSPLTINVELKPTGDPAPLIKACAPILSPLQKGLHRLIVSSFDPRVLAAALDAEVPWRLAFLYETLDALPLLNFLDTRAALDLHPMHSLVDAEHLARYETSPFNGAPRAFRTWTVDDPDEAQRLCALGVHAIITNTPQALAATLNAP